MARSTPTDRVMRGGLRVLTRLADSDTADRLGLREPGIRLLRRAARSGFVALNQAGQATKRFTKPAPAPDQPDRMQAADTPRKGVFDLKPTDEQQSMRDAVQRFSDEVLRPAAREADRNARPPDEVLAMAWELGLGLMAIPESFEGAGEARSAVGNTLILQDLARGDMGLAMAIAAPLAVIHALVDWGTAAQQAKYLPAFAGEEFVAAALALQEPGVRFDPLQLATRATRTASGFTLTGAKTLVPLGTTAELWLVAADLEGTGTRLFCVERGTQGLSVEPEPAMGLRSADLSRLTLDRAELGPDALLGDDSFSAEALVDRSRLGWCALATGTVRSVLDYCATYCNERIAFGEPISHRQAVAFALADMATELEGMELLTWKAAGRADDGADLAKEVALARAYCAEHGMEAGTWGVQLLGGHGYVTDHPVELWYRHLRAVGLLDGAVMV